MLYTLNDVDWIDQSLRKKGVQRRQKYLACCLELCLIFSDKSDRDVSELFELVSNFKPTSPSISLEKAKNERWDSQTTVQKCNLSIIIGYS